MSATGPGQFGGYAPPPPPPSSKKSPWLYVGLGCGGLILLTFGGCAIGGAILFNKGKQALSEPLDIAKLKQDMADTPVYPGAELDETATKSGRFGGMIMKSLVPSASMAIAAYDTPDPMEKVFSFYQKTLTDSGYKSKPSKQQQMDMYQKESEMVAIEESPGASRSGKTVFLVFRFHGIKSKGGD